MIAKRIGLIEILRTLDNVDNWGLEAINAPRVWYKTKGEGVKILVIDTGIEKDHPDLKHAFKFGINMFEKSEDVTDEFGHGTHVAGLLVGLKTGVAPEAELYVAKVLDSNGNGSLASVMDGITCAINMEVDILCMSLGTANGLPQIFTERISEAYKSGITIICATGNNDIGEPQYPSFLDEVIAVGGIGKDFKRASFSNYGEQMDVVAPAVEIVSTYKNGKYAKMTGTSMASPLVAGAIALIISYNRKKGIELTPKDIKEMLKKLGTHSDEYGHGIMDLTKLMD